MQKKFLVILAVLAMIAGTAVIASAETATVVISGGTLSVTAANVTLAGVTLDGTDQTTTSTSNSWTAQDSRGTGLGWHTTLASTDFTTDDVQRIYTDVADGTFTLTYDGQGPTVPINEDDPASAVKSALEGLSNITTVTVTGDGTAAIPWIIRFDVDTGQDILVAADTTLVSTVALQTIDISVADQQFQMQLADVDITVTAGNTKPTSSVTSLTDIADSTLTFMSAATDEGMGSFAMDPDFDLEVRAETYKGTYTATLTVAAISGP